MQKIPFDGKNPKKFLLNYNGKSVLIYDSGLNLSDMHPTLVILRIDPNNEEYYTIQIPQTTHTRQLKFSELEGLALP